MEQVSCETPQGGLVNVGDTLNEVIFKVRVAVKSWMELKPYLVELGDLAGVTRLQCSLTEMNDGTERELAFWSGGKRYAIRTLLEARKIDPSVLSYTYRAKSMGCNHEALGWVKLMDKYQPKELWEQFADQGLAELSEFLDVRVTSAKKAIASGMKADVTRRLWIQTDKEALRIKTGFISHVLFGKKLESLVVKHLKKISKKRKLGKKGIVSQLCSDLLKGEALRRADATLIASTPELLERFEGHIWQLARL